MGIFGKKLPQPFPWEVKLPPVDLNKRYDVYYSLHQGTVLIYKNIKFKEKRSLPAEGHHGIGEDFWLVEQEDGSELYLPLFPSCYSVNLARSRDVKREGLSNRPDHAEPLRSGL